MNTIEAEQPVPIPSPAARFWAGVRAELPILLGVAPFGLIYGVLAVGAGIPLAPAQGMSSIVFGGSSQFIAAQLIQHSTPAAIVILTIGVVNLRHALYSASVAPYLHKLPARWKALLAYLLTDECYAVAITEYNRPTPPEGKHWFYLGAGLALWTCWQASTAVGILLGAVVPAEWSLDFTLALTFIALLVPNIKDRPALAAAVVAGVVALAAYPLPYKLGLVAAALAGILAGLWSESTVWKSG